MGILDNLFGFKKKGKIEFTNFTDSESFIDEDKFWQIIKTTKDIAKNNFEKQQVELAKELKKLTLDEIILFGNRFRFFRGKANTWELWGAIYIIHGGCGDDSFNDFREWVIGQGKEFYYKTIEDPETLVEVDSALIEDSDWEGLGYVAAETFEKLTGKEMPYPFKENFETTGVEWEEESDDLKSMFPKLYRKYPNNI